ncbi:hypothetical protein TSAR_012749 [Trichomalopsis sarcophagae]|uniref:Endonuclease/exonuclease/phosphatase domain-containing protein n=1 Tax=Trichomalopsis sarcophagae TaxID=543379 RepID=A0A232EK62_9HYME|nr:hypothetical protein TSAR_012749 [Trichomalopsis sarcophagae]
MGDSSVVCPYCKVDVSEGVFCAGCDRLYHTSRSGRVGADDQGRFSKFCKPLRAPTVGIQQPPLPLNGAGPLTQTDSGLSSSHRLEMNTYTLKSTNENLRKLQTCLADLDGRVCHNALEISAIKAWMDNLSIPATPADQSTSGVSSQQGSPMESVIAELQDRLNRKSNIILYNQPRRTCCRRRFTKPIRKGSPPPIIVRLSSKSDFGRVLRSWRSLPNGIQVAADRTKTQREAYGRLRQEADAYNKNHTDKKRIRYVNGSPKPDCLLELKSYSPDFIIFTETWLTPDISSAELVMAGYAVHCCDKEVSPAGPLRGGVVLVAVRDCIPAHLESTNSTAEQIFIRITSPGTKISIGAVYIKPSSGSAVYKGFCQAVKDMMLKRPDHQLFLLGDFNIPRVSWDVISHGGEEVLDHPR